MALVNFKRGTKPADVSSLNGDTIYFFTDTKEIYLGGMRYAGDPTDILSRLTEVEGDVAEIETDIASLQAWQATHTTEYNNLKTAVDKKLDSVTAADASITIGGTETAKTVKVAISETEDNILELEDDGLYVSVEELPETALTDYTVSVATKTPATTGMAKTYEIKQGASGEETVVGTIDIPKDMVVSEGSVVTENGEGESGTFIKLVLNNGDELYVDVADLVDTVEANNGTDPVITITVTDGTKISATLNNGKVLKTHLATAVQTTLDHADAAYEALTWGTL